MPLLDPWSAVEKRPPINEHFILVNSTFTIFFAIRRRRVELHLGNTSPFKKIKKKYTLGVVDPILMWFGNGKVVWVT